MLIETERLRLRMLQPEDAEWMAREIARPPVHRWLTTPPNPYGIEDARQFIDANWSDPKFRVICVEKAPQGLVSLTERGNNRPDLGYWLQMSAWGQGYMTEACQALLTQHFLSSDSDVESGWIVGNAASSNVLRKLGFQSSGTSRQWSNFYSAEVDQDRVVLTKHRWQALRHAV